MLVSHSTSVERKKLLHRKENQFGVLGIDKKVETESQMKKKVLFHSHVHAVYKNIFRHYIQIESGK